jgi:hypothetical protein
MNAMKTLLVLTMGIFLSAWRVFAADAQLNATTLERVFDNVPLPEVPLEAAKRVRAARPPARAETTASVVTAAVLLQPALAPSLVGAIAKTAPEMAAIAAGKATELQPRLAVEIATAAVAAAPAEAGAIVTAVCRAAPQEYRQVIAAALRVAPAASKEILQGVASAFPELKPDLQTVLARTDLLSVPTVIESVRGLPAVPPSRSSSSPVLPRSPSAAPVPASVPAPLPVLSGSGTPADAADSGPGRRGGRNYAAP